MFEAVTTPRDLIALARERQAAVRRAEADVLAIAYEWAIAHPAEADGSDAAGFHHPFGIEPISGDRTPEVAEFCVAELGAALGTSTEAAKKLIGHALELAHRLPKVWARVQAGEVPAWRARLVAEATIHTDPSLTPEAMAWIDAQVAPFLGKVGKAQTDRLVEQAIKLHGLATTDPEDPDEHDARFVQIDAPVGPFAGNMRIEAEVSNADGHDLIEALRAGAAALKEAGCWASLDVRRSMALGELARHQTALDLEADHGPARSTARRVDLHLHFTAEAQPDGTTGINPIGFMENHQRLALLDQVRSWVRDTGTTVRILPVIDLNEPITVDRYEPTERLKRQIHLRDRTCVFPWCARPARRCDVDHVEPFDHDARGEAREQPGPTTTDNLGSLCRHHHRLKTHGNWKVETPASGVFHWTSPHGQRFRRDRQGTSDLTDDATVSRAV